MSKNKNNNKPHKGSPKNSMLIMTAYEATMASKPRFDGFAGGYGVHGDRKYNRAKEKRNWNREQER